MSAKEIIAEIKRHKVADFEQITSTAKEVQLAVEYLESIGQVKMATKLKAMADEGLIRLGDLEGFVAAAAEIGGKEYIFMSNKYEEYNSVPERFLNLVHEIGATKSFGCSDKMNQAFAHNAGKWFEQKEGISIASLDDAFESASEAELDLQDAEIEIQEPVQKPKSTKKSTETPKKKSSAAKKETQYQNLVDALLAQGLITEEQLEDARQKQKGAKRSIQDLLIEMEFVKEEDVVKVLEKNCGMPVTHLTDEEIDPEALQDVSFQLTMLYGVFPMRYEDGILLLAMSDPLDLMAMDGVGSVVGARVKPVLAPLSEIKQFIADKYESSEEMYELLGISEGDGAEDVIEFEEESAEELIDGMESEGGPVAKEEEDVANLPPAFQALLKGDSPTVKLVNLILSDAVKARASDIHIEPREKTIEIRYRIDGDLKNILNIPIKFLTKMIARVKILASLDIAQHIEPQDGRIHLSINKKKVDFRVSTIPTIHGEKIVARILDASEAKTEINEVGFEKEELGVFLEAVKAPQGMVFVTGPTGSGKTSTLYAALNHIKSETTNIITIEDPIEFVNEGINQIQVNPARGVTFASGLRSILRQDPNVILIGEIRDKETAEIAVKASLTGHLVLSTLHTNSTIATITRLADIGLDYYQIASSVLLIVSQRLAKVICTECKKEYTLEQEFLDKFKEQIAKYDVKTFYKGEGCQRCNFTGYHGRTAIFEVLRITEKLKGLIAESASEEQILKQARADGIVLLVESGVKKVKEGLTTLEEVAKNVGTLEADSGEPPPDELPATREEAIEQQQNTPAPVPAKKRKTPLILAVDDEADILKVLIKNIESGGYDVISARDGAEGLEMTFKERPDLIVTDVMMPNMNGFELTQKLRSSLETAVIPIMMLTAKQDRESELEGLDIGADDYLTKPFDKEKLLARIKILLKRSRQ